MDEVYEFRPEEMLGKHAYQPMLRYNNGLWTKDDGEFDLAFISDPEHAKGLTFNIYFEPHYMTNMWWVWWNRKFNPKHPELERYHTMLKPGCVDKGERIERYKFQGPISDNLNQRATQSAEQVLRDRESGYNGLPLSLKIDEKTIQHNLLRNAITHEIIKPPAVLHCIHCGEIHFDLEKWQEIVPDLDILGISKTTQNIQNELNILLNQINPTGRIIDENEYKSILKANVLMDDIKRKYENTTKE